MPLHCTPLQPIAARIQRANFTRRIEIGVTGCWVTYLPTRRSSAQDYFVKLYRLASRIRLPNLFWSGKQILKFGWRQPMAIKKCFSTNPDVDGASIDR